MSTHAYISDLFIPEHWGMPGHLPPQLGASNNLWVKKGMGVRRCVEGLIMNSWGPRGRLSATRDAAAAARCAIWGGEEGTFSPGITVYPGSSSFGSCGVAVILIMWGVTAAPTGRMAFLSSGNHGSRDFDGRGGMYMSTVSRWDNHKGELFCVFSVQCND